jgi:hypothetical protein
MPSFIKIGSHVRKLFGGREGGVTHTDTERMLIS